MKHTSPKRMQWLLLVLSVGAIWLYIKAEPYDRASPVSLSVEQLTSGPGHHLFGYIGQSLTIPWNASGRYILALQTDFHDRLPGQDDAAEVVVVDTMDDNTLIPLDKTLGWNLQQGTMFYWNPGKPDTQFFFNDRDPISGRVFTVLFDIEAGKRIREYKFPDHSIGNSGVAPTGGIFAAINYGRMARLRPVTGYAGSLDPTGDEKAPANDGIFLVDIESGQANLLVSFKTLASLLEDNPYWEVLNKRWTPVPASSVDGPETSEAALYINHTLFSRDGSKIYFFVRGRKDKQSIWLNVPCSINVDGTGLTIHTIPIGGHPEWAEGDLMIGANQGRQVFYDMVAQKIIEEKLLGNKTIFPNPEGDISLSPDGKWFVNGYSIEKGESIVYVIMRLEDGAYERIGPFDRGPYTKGDLRTDPAPRWNRDSNAILVPGWNQDGTRQLFVIRIK